MGAPVIDFHIHCAEYDEYTSTAVAWFEGEAGKSLETLKTCYGDTAGMEAALDEMGVDYAVVVADVCPAVTGYCHNERVARLCRGSRRLIPFATINPHLQADGAAELRRLVEEEGFKGLKIYPTYQYFFPNEALIYPMYAEAQRLGIPVMLHTGSSTFRGARLKYGDPLYLDDVAVDFPDLTIILVHGGRGFWYDRAAFLARIHDHIYLEVAGLPPKKLLTYFPDLERISDKVLLGTDWPGVRSVPANIEAIRNLAISDQAKEKILGGNAARLLGIDY